MGGLADGRMGSCRPPDMAIRVSAYPPIRPASQQLRRPVSRVPRRRPGGGDGADGGGAGRARRGRVLESGGPRDAREERVRAADRDARRRQHRRPHRVLPLAPGGRARRRDLPRGLRRPRPHRLGRQHDRAHRAAQSRIRRLVRHGDRQRLQPRTELQAGAVRRRLQRRVREPPERERHDARRRRGRPGRHRSGGRVAARRRRAEHRLQAAGQQPRPGGRPAGPPDHRRVVPHRAPRRTRRRPGRALRPEGRRRRGQPVGELRRVADARGARRRLPAAAPRARRLRVRARRVERPERRRGCRDRRDRCGPGTQLPLRVRPGCDEPDLLLVPRRVLRMRGRAWALIAVVTLAGRGGQAQGTDSAAPPVPPPSPPPPAPALIARSAPRPEYWLRPAASLLVPGTGQLLAHQDRGAVYLAAELIGLLRYAHLTSQGRGEARRYRALALDVGRRQFAPTLRDTVFEYYETMERFTASGRYNLAPGPALVPESDPATYNGTVWLFARQTYWADPNTPPDPSTPAYMRAVEFYQAHAVGPDFLWSWSDASLEQGVFREAIRKSDAAYRRAQNQLGLLLANHVLSAIDALISSRLAAAAGRSATLETTVTPGAAFVRVTIEF